MPGWIWKRWVWAVVGGTAVAVGSAVIAHADGRRPAAATTGYTLNESITLKFPGQPDRKVTVVKTTRKPSGATETVVKDPRTGETFTLTDNAWDGKANPPAAAPAAKPAAPAAKANTLPRARPRTDPPPAPKGNDPTPAALGSAFDSAPRSTPGKPPAATVSPAAGLGSAFGPAPAPVATPKPAPAASGPTRLPATVAPLPGPTHVADRDKDRRLFGGRRDSSPARPAPVVEAAPEGDKKPGILGRLFGSKKSTPAPGPSAMPAAPYPAPPAPYVPPVTTATPYVPPAPAASPNSGSLAFPSPSPSAEPPRVMPPKPATPPPTAVRSTPVVPPKPVVAVPAPLPAKPAPVAKPAPEPTPEPPPVVKSTPAPVPVAKPAPVPVAKPAPEPTPEPPPAPVSKPAPEPTPVPVPVTKPAPEPTAVPVPRPESKPVVPPASVPVPLPPVSAPVVPPVATPVPVPAPVSAPVSAPAVPPVATPVPVPVPLPTIPLPGPQSAAPAGGVTHAGYVAVEPAVLGDVKPFATTLRDAAAPSARIRAAKGLADGRHGSTDHVKGLLFRAAQADPCPAVQAACIDHLCHLGYYHPAFLTYLKTACDAPADEVRESAKAALAKMTPRQP